MKTATGNAVLKAYNKAAKKMEKHGLIASAVSAGFIIPEGQKKAEREGFQVFVKVCRYSEKLLRSKPETGGLLCKK